MDSTEFSMTASQRRSLKKKEKKSKKQAAKGTPAVQPQATHPTPSSDSAAEQKENDKEDDEDSNDSAASDHEETPDQAGNSSIAEDIIAAAAAAGVKSTNNDDNDSQMSESSNAHLEKCLDRKEEPPAWLLRLVMRDVDNTDEQFERDEGDNVLDHIQQRSACVLSTLHKIIQLTLMTRMPWGRSALISPTKPRAITNSSQAAATALATVPVAEATSLEGNGAAPSTNTEELQDTGGKRKAGGGVAIARTFVMATVAAAPKRVWSRE